MKLFRAILVIFIFQIPMPAQTSSQSLEGMVVDRVTSMPVAGVNLELTGIAGDRVATYTTKSDAQGKFSFRNIAVSAGYWLVAQRRDAYLQTIFGQRGLYGMGTQIAVAAGQQVVGLRVPMIPTGEISGRVLTTEGKPLGDAQVLAMAYSYREDALTLRSGGQSFVETNRRGEYRITGLPPGAYTVRVFPRNGPGETEVFARDIVGNIPGIVRGPIRFEAEGYPVAYFPDVAEELRAGTVDVPAGRIVSGVDVTVEKVRSHRIRGSVVDSTGKPLGPAEILLIPRSAGAGEKPALVISSADGSFDERGILPGSYFLVARAGDPRSPVRGRVLLDMADSDIDNVRIPVDRGYTLSGQLTFEGSPGAIDPARVRITLKPNPPSSSGLGPPGTVVEPTVQGNSFFFATGLPTVVDIPAVQGSLRGAALEFRDIHTWEYSVIVENPFDEMYVQSIRLAGIDVLANRLRVEGPIRDSLQVVMRAGAGRIDGRVLDADGKPMAHARVVLAPPPDQRLRQDLFQDVWTDDRGSFGFRKIAPGDYKMFAFEHAETNSWRHDSFLHLYEGQGKAIRVERDGRMTLELQSIPPWY